MLLGLETYSLLIGALALFAVVSALMVLTPDGTLAGPAGSRGGGGMSDFGSARDFAAIIAAPTNQAPERPAAEHVARSSRQW